MKRVFLIGYPVDHSVSPEMHNAAFGLMGIEWSYQILPAPRGRLGKIVQRLLEDDCVGANVTIPHKVAVMSYLDDVSENALRMGAVNTIVKRNGRLIGENTDGEGFMKPLRQRQDDVRGTRVVILGAGGAARAVAFALAESGVERITILNRTESHANSLAGMLYGHMPHVDVAVGDVDQIGQADIVVNATSVGMVPNAHDSPMPRGTRVPRGAIAYDLVYRPRRTRFLSEAEMAGARTVDGLAMLVFQGAEALRLWTGSNPPIQAMSDAAEHALAAGNSEQAALASANDTLLHGKEQRRERTE